MENASKALLMASGILIGVLILALIAVLFLSTKDVHDTYEQTKQAEAIQRFNTNFTKYIGQKITIHEVVTICNFASKENNKVHDVTIIGNTYTKEDIEGIVNSYTSDESSIKKYEIKIESYSNEGYVNSISFD